MCVCVCLEEVKLFSVYEILKLCVRACACTLSLLCLVVISVRNVTQMWGLFPDIWTFISNSTILRVCTWDELMYTYITWTSDRPFNTIRLAAHT